MTARTLDAAEALARAAVRDHALAAGRTKPNDSDRAAGAKLKAGLLWSLEAADGGFIGLSDADLSDRASAYGLSLETVTGAMWAPVAWPQSEIKTEREAA